MDGAKPMIRNLLIGVAVIVVSSGAFAADQGQIDGTKALVACMRANNHDDLISDAATIGRVIYSACNMEFRNSWRMFRIPYNDYTANQLNKHGLDMATKLVLEERELLEQAKECIAEGGRRIARLAETATTPQYADQKKRFERFFQAVK